MSSFIVEDSPVYVYSHISVGLVVTSDDSFPVSEMPCCTLGSQSLQSCMIACQMYTEQWWSNSNLSTPWQIKIDVSLQDFCVLDPFLG